MQAKAEIPQEYVQGTQEWLDLRKSKITATDAVVIMGASPWKTRNQLYEEKLSSNGPLPRNERMQRGIDLEPVARKLFEIKTGIEIEPIVIVKDWVMASLDGYSEPNRCVVEIKCPGARDHAVAASGKIPDHYYPQLQHQLYVSGVQLAYYFSFDGVDGVIVKINRDDQYIEKMIEEEWKFYQCMINKTPPQKDPDEYTERYDDLWVQCAKKWQCVTVTLKQLEQEEQALRNQLIFLSGESNSRGAGISLCRVERKGNVDYSKIPQLREVDLDLYRKGSSSSWRICQT